MFRRGWEKRWEREVVIDGDEYKEEADWKRRWGTDEARRFWVMLVLGALRRPNRGARLSFFTGAKSAL